MSQEEEDILTPESERPQIEILPRPQPTPNRWKHVDLMHPNDSIWNIWPLLLTLFGIIAMMAWSICNAYF